ncbi:DNA polymerase III subunit chi [Thiolinea disciformis]|uniref:DNA polymerase III subunit chi n=1 Tax=Thiolinea disciformis TaxID=125614 RepID=UPI00035D69AC|nr:DNA polymerase III subunit chi [Thiolinea disciformis]
MPEPLKKPQIAFYVGQSSSLSARLRLACKLVEKAYAQQLSTYIYTDSLETTELLDDLLWTYQDTSFIPHSTLPRKDSATFILIGHTIPAEKNLNFLINLSNQIPSFFEQFERFAEVIDQEEMILRAGRDRYQTYNKKGYNLTYHQLR